ncbi:MAG: head GIN domain-containing protein [Bacteroidota bacterium]
MKKILSLTVLFFSLCTYAQNNSIDDDGNIETRTVETFNAIEVSDGIDVYLTSGEDETVKVTAADEKYLDKLITEVEGNTLKIYYDNKGIHFATNNKRKLKAYISYKVLQSIIANGNATISLENTLEADHLQLTFTGGASFNGGIEANEINVKQNTASGVSISGKASVLNVESASGASFKGYDFIADYCNAKATGGAVIRITINKELTAKAKTGGGIRYKGNGLLTDLDINTGGAVKKDEE